MSLPRLSFKLVWLIRRKWIFVQRLEKNYVLFSSKVFVFMTFQRRFVSIKWHKVKGIVLVNFVSSFPDVSNPTTLISFACDRLHFKRSYFGSSLYSINSPSFLSRSLSLFQKICRAVHLVYPSNVRTTITKILYLSYLYFFYSTIQKYFCTYIQVVPIFLITILNRSLIIKVTWHFLK